MATQPPSFLATIGPQVKYDPITDKIKFEKELSEVVSKALQASEVPVKEKHIRSAIISTWREKGCTTLWKIVKNHPLQTGNTVCYKACYLLHKMLRDGYHENAKKSSSSARYVSDMAKHWNHLGDGYSRMITAYLKVLWNKIAFHVKNPDIPANLNFLDKPFVVPNDVDYVFQLTVEIFDYQSSILHFYAAVLANVDISRGMTANQIQCRIAPFVPAIQDSAALYDLVYKLMKALHTSLPADTLVGHRERFTRQYHALRKYFMEASKMAYIKKLVEVPTLPPDPPNFLIGSYIDDLQLSQQVIVQQFSEDSLQRTSTLDGTLIELQGTLNEENQERAPFPLSREDTDTRFNTIFGQQEFEPFVNETPPQSPQQDEKDVLIEQLMREIVELKQRIQELEEQNSANLELIGGLRQQLEQKQTELGDYKEVAEQACNENVLLKQQLEASTSSDQAQIQAEERIKATDQKFTQLRDIYQKLRNEHIMLLRSSGENQKKLTNAEKHLLEEETARLELERSVSSLSLQLEEIKQQAIDESAHLTSVKESLRIKEVESSQFQHSAIALREQLLEAEQSTTHSHIVKAIEQAEEIIKHVMIEITDPSFAGLTCTPGYLLTRTKRALDVIDSVTNNFSLYNNDPSALGGALGSLSSFAQSISGVILHGAATAHMTSAQNGLKLTNASKSIGEGAFKYLTLLKKEKPDTGEIAGLAGELQRSVMILLKEAEELAKDASLEEKEHETLGDIVEEELASTSLAVNEAAIRIEEMLRRSHEEHTGVNLEVNSRILDSCTDLMKAIQILIQRSKDLQKEIVSEGLGTMSNPKDFYKKHHTWSEGLISAAKQVGFAATLLVDSADKAVSGEGKFEQLIVTSREIAASTAQLVAASKVKAHSRSEKLKALKSSSRSVSEATGTVVASAQSGAQLKSESESKTDFTKLTLNQAKRLEMESQVRALELEKELEMERTRLAELRKTHYRLGGVSEGWDEEQ